MPKTRLLKRIKDVPDCLDNALASKSAALFQRIFVAHNLFFERQDIQPTALPFIVTSSFRTIFLVAGKSRSMLTQAPSSKRNIASKSVVIFFLGLGMVFAFYAVCSCRWFGFNNASHSTTKWDFLRSHSNNATAASAVGLFGYKASFDDSNDSSHSIRDGQCILYEPGFPDDHWIFFTQILVVMGPFFAAVAIIEYVLIGVHRNCALYLGDAAAFIQAASVVLSLSLCDQHSSCSWFLGAFANIAATCCFFVSLIFALCKLEEATTDEDPEKTVSVTDLESLQHDGQLYEEEDWTIFFGPVTPDIDDEECNNHLLSVQTISEIDDHLESERGDPGVKDPIIQRPVKDNVFIVRDMKSKLHTRQAKIENDSTIVDATILNVVEYDCIPAVVKSNQVNNQLDP
jgi:hypothetical protein